VSQHGADIDLANFSGVTALMCAAHSCNGVVVELLLQRGARVDLVPHAGPWKTDNALKIARRMLGNERVVKLLEKAFAAKDALATKPAISSASSFKAQAAALSGASPAPSTLRPPTSSLPLSQPPAPAPAAAVVAPPPLDDAPISQWL
jgi:hypothetical protein